MASNAARSVYVGTAGWSYPRGAGTWDGVFYPPKMAEKEKLSFYARFLDMVEVNSTFYRPVGVKTMSSWVERTPPDFRFAIKLFQKFTHPKMYKEATGKTARADGDDVSAFKKSLEPMVSSDKLAALLAQFPPSFKSDQVNQDHLESLIRDFREYPLSVELRHRSWSESPETAELFREYDVAWTMIDEPRFKTSIREVPLTSRLGYFRFHGRNYKNWWHGDRESRYDYLYSPDEQAELLADAQQVAENAALTFAVYNNHFGGKSLINAIEMKQALGGRVDAELPTGLMESRPELGKQSPAKAK
jgi:uncharacterized protein YecE (DUF72 family)